MVTDMDAVTDPLRNRGTAFTDSERTTLGLHGVLPLRVESLDEQAARAYAALAEHDRPLEKHIYLRELQDTNEVLFYRLVADHLAEVLPIIYTPTVALACQAFSRIYRRPRGLFLTYPMRDRMREVLHHRRQESVDVIVVTDGERVLGIGDQGIGGMGIPIGKLSLYTAIGGIDPARTLPITLDVGTNDESRLASPGYLGWRHHRVTGSDYDSFVDQFVEAVKAELPNVLLQWEDFAIDHARPILEHYRDDLLTFNDDIQGTAAVTLATVLAASDVSGTALADHRIAILGAGSAATGVADYLTTALVADGLSREEAQFRFALVDVDGLLTQDRHDLSAAQRPYARPAEEARRWAPDGRPDLEAVVSGFRPTVLIGLSTAAGAFTERVVRAMAARTRHPVILPLSNPSSRAEADPADVLAWTEGHALVATGSPFPAVPSGQVPVTISQCNNAFIFPAMGLAVVAANATRVTDAMFLAAARQLADLSPARDSAANGLLPSVTSLPDIAPQVALAVALQAVADGVAPRRSAPELGERIERSRWVPEYA